jgi:hypothetical protein
MGGNLKVNAVQLGDSVTDSQNFILQTNTDGTAKLARGSAGTLGSVIIVDANNSVIINSLNGGQLAGFRNRIINGGMQVAQRGNVTPGLGSLTTYTLDRWACYQTGAAAAISQGTGDSATFPYALAFSGVASNTEVTLFQCIESANCFDLSQTGFTLSVKIYANTVKTITIGFSTPTTTKDTFGATTTNLPSGSTTFSHPGTGWVTTTFSYSAANAIANAAAIQRGLRVLISFPNCTSGVFGFTGVQLEAGSIATPFEQRPYGLELALCQRYYTTATVYFGGPTVAGWSNDCFVSFKNSMRAVPTLTSLGGTAAGSVTTVTTSLISVDGFKAITNNSGTGQGSANNSWTASAEL